MWSKSALNLGQGLHPQKLQSGYQPWSCCLWLCVVLAQARLSIVAISVNALRNGGPKIKEEECFDWALEKLA